MTRQDIWARIVDPDPDLRAGDSDRERVAGRLRESHAEGRLDLTEFQQRLERCYEAKTVGQLRELVKDLPRPEPPAGRRAGASLRLAPWRLVPFAPLLILLIVVSALTGHHVFWLWVPLTFLFFWRMSWWRRRRWVGGARRGPDDWI
jgi:Flp pilus assembly protein TadB